MKNRILAFLLATTMICTGFITATPVLAESSTTVTVTKTTPAADTEAPTGSISIADNKWSEFLSTITFGTIFKEKKTVTIDSHDNVAVDSVKYHVSNTALSIAEVQKISDADWNTYEDGFSLEPVSRYVVYALITDTSGNRTYISSDGLVFINESAPVLSVTDITQTSFKAGINLDENTLDAVSKAGVKYRKKGDTNWTTVTVSDLRSENTISVDDLQAGTEYEIVSFVEYKDGTGYESGTTNVQTEATQLPQGKITVSVKNATGETKNATVSIVRGNEVIAGIEVKDIGGDGASVDAEELENLPDGIYNIVIRTVDGKFADTKMIEIKDGSSASVEFEILKGEFTNVVSVKENTPAVAVDGISDAVNDNEHVVSAEEKQQIENGEISMELRFEVEKKDEKDAEGAGEIKKLAEDSGLQIDTFLDMSLIKVTKILSGSGEGTTSTTNVGSVNSQVFMIAIPYDTENVEDIRVIRYHDGNVQELAKLEAMPQDTEQKDGTYYIGDGYIYVFASGFSTYAIARNDSRAENTNVPGESGIAATMPTGADKADAKITGVDASMEYSTDNGINWTPVTGNEITGLSSGKVLIRYAGTDTVKPGEAIEITVPQYAAPEPGKEAGPKAPDASRLTVTSPTSKDAADGKITGVDSTMEYSTDGGRTWKDVTGTEITGIAGGTNVIIRVKETDTANAGEQLTVYVKEYAAPAQEQEETEDNTEKPAAQQEKKSGRAVDSSKVTAAAPTSKTATDGKITGVDSTMEYSTDSGKTWKDVTGTEITNLSAGEIWIRVKETSDTAAGEILKVTVPAYSAQVATVSITKTGDSNSYVFSLIALAAAALCIGTGVRRSRKQH